MRTNANNQYPASKYPQPFIAFITTYVQGLHELPLYINIMMCDFGSILMIYVGSELGSK